MSTMVERVARAIYEAGPHATAPKWENRILGGHIDDEFMRLSRAAIEALIPFLREVPNTSLVETGQRDPHWIWDDAADSQREAIIGYVQAALKESE